MKRPFPRDSRMCIPTALNPVAGWVAGLLWEIGLEHFTSAAGLLQRFQVEVTAIYRAAQRILSYGYDKVCRTLRMILGSSGNAAAVSMFFLGTRASHSWRTSRILRNQSIFKGMPLTSFKLAILRGKETYPLSLPMPISGKVHI